MGGEAVVDGTVVGDSGRVGVGAALVDGETAVVVDDRVVDVVDGATVVVVNDSEVVVAGSVVVVGGCSPDDGFALRAASTSTRSDPATYE